jgi:hypothetical protein
MDHGTIVGSRYMVDSRPWARGGRSGARELVVIAQRERERSSSGFSSMASLGGGAVEMTT